MNLVARDGLDTILLKQLRKKLENKCSQHGFVIPNSLEILSRSMGLIESGHYTGNIVFHVQSQGRVFNPVNGTRIVGTILKKNKMGLYIIYKDAVRILIPRDRHLHEQDIMDEFESLEIGDSIEVEIRKSRFQIHDTFILSVGAYLGRADSTLEADTVLPNNKPIQNISEVLTEA
jgi:DNA-directed RNA polymerase subunit E'/Rpb7